MYAPPTGIDPELLATHLNSFSNSPCHLVSDRSVCYCVTLFQRVAGQTLGEALDPVWAIRVCLR